MKRLILKKLRSNEGASLTYAILLFLVCAVVGSIVLTAGTIASGRLAEKAEMDQRYYHVTSTAEFLKDALDGKSVRIIRENTNPIVIRIEGYDDPLPEDFEDSFQQETNFYNYDFLTLKTLQLMPELTWEADFYDQNAKVTNIKFQVSGQEHVADVKVTVKNGVMTMDISDNGYTVRMNFAPQISEVNSLNDENIETKTATITWRVNSIEKVFG
ncbi:MAG: hypothetical protein IJH00_02225 [Erysipelotrichaceae bacterium]|nr:hypothetical protein [Erysipelotrichaceae bacterium]